MKIRLILLIFLMIISCTPFPRQVMQDVNKEIEFSDAFKDPEKFKEEAVIWGGVIVETVSKPDETLLIVRQTNLDFQKRPNNLDKYSGRFIIQYRGFLDPSIYSRDREITVAGTIKGREERLIGEYRYRYPIIDTRAIHLWEKRGPKYYYDPWYPYPIYPYRW